MVDLLWWLQRGVVLELFKFVRQLIVLAWSWGTLNSELLTRTSRSCWQLDFRKSNSCPSPPPLVSLGWGYIWRYPKNFGKIQHYLWWRTFAMKFDRQISLHLSLPRFYVSFIFMIWLLLEWLFLYNCVWCLIDMGLSSNSEFLLRVAYSSSRSYREEPEIAPVLHCIIVYLLNF